MSEPMRQSWATSGLSGPSPAGMLQMPVGMSPENWLMLKLTRETFFALAIDGGSGPVNPLPSQSTRVTDVQRCRPAWDANHTGRAEGQDPPRAEVISVQVGAAVTTCDVTNDTPRDSDACVVFVAVALQLRGGIFPMAPFLPRQ